MWLLMSATIVLCIHPVSAWFDDSYSRDNPCGMDLPDKPYPDDGISDLDQLNDNKTLRLGAFNIQVFGKSKAAKPKVMAVLGKIVVAIQGLRRLIFAAISGKMISGTTTMISRSLMTVSNPLPYSWNYSFTIAEFVNTPASMQYILSSGL